MTCRDQTITELLPSYLEGSLDAQTASRVERHLLQCNECAAEFRLLHALANDRVPDPGDAFWTSLPDRIHREVRRQTDEAPGRRSLAAFFLSPWTGGAVAVASVLLISWLLFRTLPQEPVVTGIAAAPVPLEDLYGDEPEMAAELEFANSATLASWMDQESLTLLHAVDYLASAGNGLDRSLDEYLSALSQEELGNLATALSQEQEAGT